MVLAPAVVAMLAEPRWAVATLASRAIGREVTLGAARIALGDPVTLILHNVSIANAAGGRDPSMAHADGVLLSGVPDIVQLSLRRPTLLLVFVARGVGNCRMASGTAGSPSASAAASRCASISTASAGDRDPIRLQAASRYNDRPLTLSGQGGRRS